MGDRVLAQLLTEMDGVEGLEGVSEAIGTGVPKIKNKMYRIGDRRGCDQPPRHDGSGDRSGIHPILVRWH